MTLVSHNPEGAEAARQKLVPNYYAACPYRKVIAQPWDHLTELTPMYVGCKQSEFQKQNSGECLGQCALAGMQYGKPTKLVTNDGGLDYEMRR